MASSVDRSGSVAVNTPRFYDCPLHMLPCDDVFNGDQVEAWKQHTLDHFGKAGPPDNTICDYCDETFEGNEAWKNRMEHVAENHPYCSTVQPQTYHFGKDVISNCATCDNCRKTFKGEAPSCRMGHVSDHRSGQEPETVDHVGKVKIMHCTICDCCENISDDHSDQEPKTDFALLRHLLKHGLIDQSTYDEFLPDGPVGPYGPDELVYGSTPPPSSGGRRHGYDMYTIAGKRERRFYS
ncbi:MAG: hypothetical protein M1840_007859 [Geoglossum simile]|nr:MAG: hypothetical protein M1840_007859 [Geoglossum simile]